MRRVALPLLIALYVLIQAFTIAQTPVDRTMHEVLARVGEVGTCFDGERGDWFSVQYAHAPTIIPYQEDGCE